MLAHLHSTAWYSLIDKVDKTEWTSKNIQNEPSRLVQNVASRLPIL